MLGFKALKDWFIPLFDGSAPGTLSLSPSQILWPYKGTHSRSSCAHTAQRSASEASLPLCAALSGQTSPGTALRMGPILQQDGLPLSCGSHSLCPSRGPAAPFQERSAAVSRGSLHRGKFQAPKGLALSSFLWRRRRLPVGGDPPPPEGHVLSVDVLTTSRLPAKTPPTSFRATLFFKKWYHLCRGMCWFSEV